DQVVVTGTVTPTEVKAIPTPITVVTAREIEQLGVTRVDQLLRGMVPGVMAVDIGPQDGNLNVTFRGGVNFDQGYVDIPVKVYIDGVEMAYTNALTQLDARNIERMEVTRGPQASTIYGAGAIIGVIQIFTKRGADVSGRPRVTAQLGAGALESQWSDGSTLTQEYSLSLAGGSSELSYQLGASHSSLGEWVPEYRSRRSSVFGGARWSSAKFSVDLSAQYSDRKYNVVAVQPYFAEQVRNDHWNTGQDAFFGTPFYPDVDRSEGTYAVNLAYQPTSWWEHRLTLGYDGYYNPRGQTRPRQLTAADTLRSFAQFDLAKTSAAYNMTLAPQITSVLSSTLTLGVDWWGTNEDFVSARQHSDGSFAPGTHFIVKREYGNRGAFAQLQLGVADALFLTAGVRADKNDNFGDDYGTAVSPRVGASYTRDLGSVTVKGRASYGKAIRSPLPFQKVADRQGLPFSEQLAAPGLAPEVQSGYDVGLELFFGARGSIQASYYDQEVEDLLSVLTLSEPGDVPTLFQWGNLGRIANSGWELQSKVSFGRIAVAATYSIFESTVLDVAPGALGDNRGQYRVGDRLLLIPKSSGGVTIAYDGPRTSIAVSAAHVGSFRNYDNIAFNEARFGSGGPAQPARQYIVDYPSSTKWNANITQELTRHLSAFLRVENIANSFAPESDNLAAMRGRMTMAGARVKL
ncbi:MAG TPA: TonB-dependent receptor, partial [Gemmatimonadaceae bacterium]|nr:TonB-dependent receptor [Gemmatimonadaceae bacterium]